MPYPVTFEADYAQDRNRLTAFFRILLAIPLLLVFYVYAILGSFGVVLAWLAIVFTVTPKVCTTLCPESTGTSRG